MEKQDVNQILEQMEEELGRVSDIVKLLDTISETGYMAEIAQYIYIITHLLDKKIDNIETLRIKLRIACVNY